MSSEDALKRALLNRVIKKRILQKREENRQNNASYTISSFIGNYIRRKQREKEADAFEKIRERLINRQVRQNYFLDLKARTPKTLKSGKTIIPYNVLTEALIQMKNRIQAKWKLEALKRKKQLEGIVPREDLKGGAIFIKPIQHPPPPKPINSAIEKYKHLQPQTSLVVNANAFFKKPEETPKIDKDNYKFNINYASVVEDATNSALSRLVELDGKQYIAQHLAIESPNIKLRKSTLSQKLGLEERNIGSNNLFSISNSRNEMPFFNPMAEARKENNAAKILQSLMKRKLAQKERNNLSQMSALGDMLSQKGKRGRLVKGSQEAKDYMARIRAMRKTKTATVAQVVAAVAPKKAGRSAKLPVFGPPNRRGRPAKYTPPAPTVAQIVAAIAPKKAGRSAKLPVFGPPNRRGRPAKYTPPAPTVAQIVAAVASKKRGRPAKLPVFGPKNRPGRPRKYKP